MEARGQPGASSPGKPGDSQGELGTARDRRPGTSTVIMVATRDGTSRNVHTGEIQGRPHAPLCLQQGRIAVDRWHHVYKPTRHLAKRHQAFCPLLFVCCAIQCHFECLGSELSVGTAGRTWPAARTRAATRAAPAGLTLGLCPLRRPLALCTARSISIASKHSPGGCPARRGPSASPLPGTRQPELVRFDPDQRERH